MENASKALIIAGAILLAIVLVSLGVLVINNAKNNITSGGDMTEATIEAFNTKISQYCGTKKSGTQMNSLMSAISSSNGAQNNKDSQHYISIKVESTAEAGSSVGAQTITITKNSSNVEYPVFSNSQLYTATYTTSVDGYINEVTIK